jgi:hypothetical protein
LPKISGKLASAGFFQPPTWFGWTSNICAVWAAVLCALITAASRCASRPIPKRMNSTNRSEN